MESVGNSKYRCIALVDCNNFYASAERVFRPDWKNRPLGVLSNNDGCIIARSNELKEAGIPMGAPYFKWKDRLSELNSVVVSSNYPLYGDMSARVMDTLSEFTSNMEIYSIDEAWLDLSFIAKQNLNAYARNIINVTSKNTGIPLSMGIGPTKVLAKIANRLCKKRKTSGAVFHFEDAEKVDDILEKYPVQDVWGIGKKLSERLIARGIRTAKDLRDCDLSWIKKSFSVVMERIVLELRGVNCLDFEDIEARKQIVCSRSFGSKIKDFDALKASLITHANRAAIKLRRQASLCAEFQFFVQSSRFSSSQKFYSKSYRHRFSVGTDDTRQFIKVITENLEQIYNGGVEYAKSGVMLNELRVSNIGQPDLFLSCHEKASSSLMGQVDRINKTIGKNAVFFGVPEKTPAWGMKQDSLTPAYTTKWEDVLSTSCLFDIRK